MPTDDICGEETQDGGECGFSAKYSDGKCGHHTEIDSQEAVSGKQSMLEADPSLVEFIAGEIQNGATVKEALAEADIVKSTHDNWLAKGRNDNAEGVYKEYRSEVTRAREIAKKSDRKSIQRDAIDQGDLRLRWKIHKEQYGDLYVGEDDEDGDERTLEVHVPEDAIPNEQ